MSEPSLESRIVKVAEESGSWNPITRRTFLKCCAAAGISVAAAGSLGSLLAACGGTTTTTAGGATTTAGGVTTTAGGATTTASTAGGGTTTTAAVIRGDIYHDVTTLTNNYFVLERGAMEQMAKAFGLNYHVFEDQANANNAINEVNTIASAGGKMMIANVGTDASIPGVVSACEKAGIWLGTEWYWPAWYTPADFTHWVFSTVPASVAIAYETAKRLFTAMGGSGTCIHVPGQKGNSADDTRTAGFNLALKEFPNIQVVTTAPGDWTTDVAHKAFNDALPSVKDFQGVFAQNDSEAVGVIAVLDALKITGKLVTGFDGNTQNIEYIAQGKQLLTSASLGSLMAGAQGVAVFDALNGYKPLLPEKFMYIEAVLVTKDTADAFNKSVYQTTELPVDWLKMSKVLHPNDWDPQVGLTPINPYVQWKGIPQDQYKLNAAWDTSLSSGEWDKVKQMYNDHYKSGPLFPFQKDSVHENPGNTSDAR